MKKILFLVLVLCAISFTNAQINLGDGLIACYPFNGNALDESGNGNNGTVSGAILGMDRLGNDNSAYSFDGNDDYIEVTNTFIPSKEITISFWSKANILKSQNVIFLLPEDVNDRLSIQVNYNHNGTPSFFWDFGDIMGSGRLGETNVPFVDQWEHYLFISSYSQDSMLAYRDGVLLKAAGHCSFLNDTARAFRIGCGPYSLYWNGLIDDINIYNRAVTKDEIQALYQGAMCGEINSINQAELTE
ncbi:MAG: LamG domain-containing protein, partial [Bacteroidales bacterium]|nr:LamG domain-containing protein [Bacteroidales bacterium]